MSYRSVQGRPEPQTGQKMPQGPRRQTGLTVLEGIVATGLVTAGSVFAWQYYHTEITQILQVATAALEHFVTS